MGKTGSEYQNDILFLHSAGRKQDYCEIKTIGKCYGLIYKILKLKTYRKLKYKINWLSDNSNAHL